MSDSRLNFDLIARDSASVTFDRVREAARPIDDGPYTYRIRCAIYAVAAFVGIALGCALGYYTT